MNTQLVKQNVNLTQWAALFKERKESGLSVTKFCEERGISRHKYFYWLKKVRTAAIESCPTTFAEVISRENSVCKMTVVDKEDEFCTQMLITFGDISIAVNEQTPNKLIASVLEVIRNA